MNLDNTKSFPELQRAPLEATRPAAPGADAELGAGTMLGRYVLLYRVGSGGMGAVYAAWDPELDRKVAIKLLTLRADPDEAERQTRREARAMARLAHPNVITVHDVGTWSDRRPGGEPTEQRPGGEPAEQPPGGEPTKQVFIAMEYVDGLTLKDWLDGEQRPWREIVDKFLQAGRGLAAAHAAGLVHLDFKPGNVMLARDGGVRVVDFGLARLAASAAEPAAATASPDPFHLQQETRRFAAGHGAVVGTPAYLAPERLLGGPVDARSDQFSFCVALWLALYGEHPFAAADREGYVSRVTSGEIREPAAATRLPGALRKALRCGLRPEPAERHPAMRDLLQALTPESWLKRHRWLAACLLAAFAVTAVFLQSTTDRVPICGGGEAKLEGIWDAGRKDTLRAAFAASGLPFAEEAYRAVERTLDGYARDWVTMHRQACEATHVHGEQSDRMLDLRMLCLDGRREEIRALTELLSEADTQSIARSVAAADKLSSLAGCADRSELANLMLPPSDPEIRAEVARIRATVEEQSALTKAQERADLALIERSAEDARRIEFAPLEAQALALLGDEQLYVAGDTAAAEETYQQALLAAVAGGDRPLQAHLYASLAETVGYFQSRPEEAQRWRAFAEATLTALGPGHEEDAVFAHSSLFAVAWSAGELADAEDLARRALATAERIWGPEDHRLAAMLNNVATAITGVDRADEAIGHLERSLVLVEKAYGDWNPIFMGPTLTNLSVAYVDAGRYQEALAVTTRCLEILEQFYGDHRDLTYPLINVAQILTYQFDRPEEAEPHLRRALPLASEGFGKDHPLVSATLVTLGDAMIRQLRLDEAETYLRQASTSMAASLPPGHPDHLATRLSFGRLFLAKGNHAEALKHLEQGLALAKPDDPFRDRIPVALLIALGEAQLGLGRPQLARPFLDRALDGGRADRLPGLGAEARFALARALGASDNERARALAGEALEMLAGDSPMTRQRRARLESWLEAHPQPR